MFDGVCVYVRVYYRIIVQVDLYVREHMFRYLQHVRDDSQAPHVCVERDKLVVNHLGSQEFRCAKIHS